MIDRAQITLHAGDGGSGAVSFRHEKFAPQGGPDGGDGGQGGSVVLQASDDMSTLQHLRFRLTYRAESGGNGGGKQMHGRSGEDLIILVPVGTVVQRLMAGKGRPGREVIADLDHRGAQVVAAHGGLGGKGNARFASSVNQAPRIAERGQHGEKADLVLDLKLIADAGIVGIPSVGKSSLIAAVSAARPKVADYPFTTLEPVLGVVDAGWETFVMVDLPGLIEGAHLGAGLGHDFLRHTERTRVLVHLLDASHPEAVQELDLVNNELAQHDPQLAARPQIVVLNKIDLPEAQQNLPALQAALQARGVQPLAISVATGERVQELITRVAHLLDELRQRPGAGWQESAGLPSAPPPGEAPVELEDGVPVLHPQPQRRFAVRKLDEGLFEADGRRLATMAEMLNLSQDEAKAEFFRRLTRFGVVASLRRAGVRPGDRVRFGETEMSWEEY